MVDFFSFQAFQIHLDLVDITLSWHFLLSGPDWSACLHLHVEHDSKLIEILFSLHH